MLPLFPSLFSSLSVCLMRYLRKFLLSCWVDHRQTDLCECRRRFSEYHFRSCSSGPQLMTVLLAWSRFSTWYYSFLFFFFWITRLCRWIRNHLRKVQPKSFELSVWMQHSTPIPASMCWWCRTVRHFFPAMDCCFNADDEFASDCMNGVSGSFMRSEKFPLDLLEPLRDWSALCNWLFWFVLNFPDPSVTKWFRIWSMTSCWCGFPVSFYCSRMFCN